jgi:hypothetical protein
MGDHDPGRHRASSKLTLGHPQLDAALEKERLTFSELHRYIPLKFHEDSRMRIPEFTD